MQMKTLWGISLVAALATGCAVPEASNEPAHERPEATTGSNIPRRARAAQAPSAPDSVPAQAARAPG